MTRRLGPNEDPEDRNRCKGCQALPGRCECAQLGIKPAPAVLADSRSDLRLDLDPACADGRCECGTLARRIAGPMEG